MAKAKFRTQFDKGDFTFIAPSGDFTELRHRAEIDKNGKRKLIKDKEVAIYDLIQASREECEIERIIQRAVEGDYNALNQANGVYTDITGAPSSIAEAQQWIIGIKEKWDELPADIKAKFENNVEIYTAEFGTEAWADKVGYTEALKTEEAARAENIKIQQDYAKAMANLAGGTTITQTGVEEGGTANE